MDVLKLFGKKKPLSFEELLQKAADEPAYQVEFINRILDEKIVIITKADGKHNGSVNLESNDQIAVYTLPDGRVPIFTSPERIHDKGIFKDKANFFEAKGKDILELLKGAKLILNPYSDYGKGFDPEEVERILDGTYFKSKQIKLEKATQFRIGQPANYPAEIVNALIKLFSERLEITAAYLGWIEVSVMNEPPHYIFAIDTNGDWRTISDEAGLTVQQIIGTQEIVDFIQIGKSSFSDYFLAQTTPFYTKNS